jgi:hypothetical protein
VATHLNEKRIGVGSRNVVYHFVNLGMVAKARIVGIGPKTAQLLNRGLSLHNQRSWGQNGEQQSEEK